MWLNTHAWTLMEAEEKFSKLNLLPDDKILDWSKLKQIAYNILQCI